MNSKYEFIRRALLRISGILTFLLLWEVGPRLGWVDTEFVPPLSIVMITIHHLWMDGNLYAHLLVSLWRATVGLLIAVIIGVPLGFILGGWLTGLARTLNPLFRIFSQVNPFSLSPVFMLFLGIDEKVKLAIIAWVCLWPILFHTITGIRMIDQTIIKTALSMGVSRWNLFLKVLLPGAAPILFCGIRNGAALAFFMLIAAEMIGANAGLGWLLHNSAMLYQIPRIYAAGTFIIFLGIVINKLLLGFENGLSVWKESPIVFSANSRVEEGIRVRKLSRWHLSVAAIIILGIVIFGGQQMEKLNDSGLNNENQSAHSQMEMPMEK